MTESMLKDLNRRIVHCEKCPRLRAHCQEIARVKRKSYLEQDYWGKPITGFGDPRAQLMIVGLAPAAHGANRTGRIFTGDRSGDWLYRALHKAGFANQSQCTDRNDGLVLKNAYVTCAVRCAPPDNKPSPKELTECSPYLSEEIQTLKQVKVYLALGQIGFNALWPFLKSTQPKPQFKHGGQTEFAPGRWLILSYHPSQQNTFTGRLTEEMFDSVFSEARRLISN